MRAETKEAKLEASLAEWRARHKIGSDDPILLVIELFQIHARLGAPILGDRSHSRDATGVSGWVAGVAVILATVGGILVGRVWR